MPALITMPKKNIKSFWHPESQDLILTAAAVTTTFAFWNAVNIRPAILTDPAYTDQAGGIIHHMKLSMWAILGISAGFAVIYGEKGYLPAVAAVCTGATMYFWTKNELDRHLVGIDAVFPVDTTDADAASLSPKRRKEQAN
jgi:hypothetical protein